MTAKDPLTLCYKIWRQLKISSATVALNLLLAIILAALFPVTEAWIIWQSEQGYLFSLILIFLVLVVVIRLINVLSSIFLIRIGTQSPPPLPSPPKKINAAARFLFLLLLVLITATVIYWSTLSMHLLLGILLFSAFLGGVLFQLRRSYLSKDPPDEIPDQESPDSPLIKLDVSSISTLVPDDVPLSNAILYRCPAGVVATLPTNDRSTLLAVVGKGQLKVDDNQTTNITKGALFKFESVSKLALVNHGGRYFDVLVF
ncbi:MAG: hypothetical protein OQK51_06660 [Kangiellaceae bacterium]|nr:hypothetical protein [Kangiellaceae bacterium]